MAANIMFMLDMLWSVDLRAFILYLLKRESWAKYHWPKFSIKKIETMMNLF